MANKLYSRRFFAAGALSASAAISAPRLLFPAAHAATNIEFHIKHWSSGAYVVPFGGRIHNLVPLALWYEKIDVGKFRFEAAEGPFGYLVSVADPRFCVYPHGGHVDAGDNTILNLYEGREPGGLFYIDKGEDGIRHISGRYWHPLGGSSRPASNTNLVIHEGIRSATKFIPTSTQSDQKVEVSVPGETSIEWVKISCNGSADDPPDFPGSREITFTRGLTTQNLKRQLHKLSIGTEVGTNVLFGTISTKLSTSYEAAITTEQSEIKNESQTLTQSFSWKAGQFACWWQRKYSAAYETGEKFDFLSGKEIRMTAGQKPTD